jgi:hypothetical protein
MNLPVAFLCLIFYLPKKAIFLSEVQILMKNLKIQVEQNPPE